MTNDNPLKVIAGIITLITVLLIAMLISSCDGCKKKPAPIENIVETIQAEAKPVEDSLRHEVKKLKSEIDSLKVIAAKASERKEIIRWRVAEKPVPTTDSGALIAYNELKNDYEQYVVSSDEQADNQGKIIVSQERIITNMQADIELQKSKFKLLEKAYNERGITIQQYEKELKKTDRKLHRAKAFNKIFRIGTAAGIGLALIVFL